VASVRTSSVVGALQLTARSRHPIDVPRLRVASRAAKLQSWPRLSARKRRSKGMHDIQHFQESGWDENIGLANQDRQE